MYNMLIEIINENILLYEYQFDFQKGKSTNMTLVTLIDKITEAEDMWECIIVVYLDFSNTFDTVDHDTLLLKLTFHGIQESCSSGLKIIYQIEFSTYFIMIWNQWER